MTRRSKKQALCECFKFTRNRFLFQDLLKSSVGQKISGSGFPEPLEYHGLGVLVGRGSTVGGGGVSVGVGAGKVAVGVGVNVIVGVRVAVGVVVAVGVGTWRLMCTSRSA